MCWLCWTFLRNFKGAVIFRLDEDVQSLTKNKILTTIDNPWVSAVRKPGLYSLILRSRKPEAKAFKRWVTHEVLPEIRKRG